MNSRICIDASLGLKLVLAEPDSERASALWARWIQQEIQICAPPLFLYEGTSAIRGPIYRRLLSVEKGDLAYNALHALTISLLSPPPLHDRAWDLAKRFNRPKVYDCYYMGLAEILECEFWTADERLFNTVKHELRWVKWIGNLPPPAASVPTTSPIH
jgi:predicted nucleic acid-binding protein